MLGHERRDDNQVGFRLALSDVVKLVLCPTTVSAVTELAYFLLDIGGLIMTRLVAGRMLAAGRTLCTIALNLFQFKLIYPCIAMLTKP